MVLSMAKRAPRATSFLGKVIAGGRVTIPKGVREYLEINEGDRVECHVEKRKP